MSFNLGDGYVKAAQRRVLGPDPAGFRRGHHNAEQRWPPRCTGCRCRRLAPLWDVWNLATSRLCVVYTLGARKRKGQEQHAPAFE